MDTISSRENNNIMPLVGVIAGVVALALSIFAIVKVNGVNKAVQAQEEKVAKIDQIEAQATAANSSADRANSDIKKLTSQTQDAVNQISTMIGDIRGAITKLEENQKAKPAVKGKDGKEPKEAPVAGPGEYIVKKGDIPAKIAKANGVSVADLQAVNPGVNWKKLATGQKLKLPAKK